MTTPTAPDYHVSIDGTVQGPLDEETARAMAAEHVAAGRQVLVWRPGWSAWVPASQVWPGPDPGTTVRASVVAGPRTAVRAAVVIGAVVLLSALVGTVHALWPQPEDTTPSTSSRPEPKAPEQQVDAPASTAPSPAGGDDSRLDAAAVCEKMKALAKTEERAGIEKFCSEGLPAIESNYPAALEKFAACVDDSANGDDLIRCTSRLPGFIEEAKEASKPKPDDWKARMKDVWNRCDDYHAELYAAKVAYAQDIRGGQCEGAGTCPGRTRLYEFNATAHKQMGAIMKDARTLLDEMAAQDVSMALRREMVRGMDTYCEGTGRYPRRAVLPPPSLE